MIPLACRLLPLGLVAVTATATASPAPPPGAPAGAAATTADRAPPAAVATFTAAAETELERALEMRLPDQPAPYLVSFELLDGNVATAEASFGALVNTSAGPYRQVRTEVRVGDYHLDNGNFEGDFGSDSGVRSRLLPHDPVLLAFRRELWLSADESYKGAAQQLSDKLAARQGVQREYTDDLYRVDPLVTPPLRPAAVDEAALDAMVQALSATLRGHGFEEGTAIARDWQGVRTLVSNEGHRASIPTGFTVVRVEAVARAEDGARLRDIRSFVAASPDGLPSLDEMQAEIEEMAAWLEDLRDAPVEDDYLGPVLFQGQAAMELFRQLLAPEMSGTPQPERPSMGFEAPDAVPTARLGRRLLPEGWRVVDDPLAAEAANLPGGYLHDFEGVPAQAVTVVEDGVTRDLLMSRVPREGFDGSNGHGRSLGNDRRVAVPASVTVDPPRTRAMARLERKGLALARDTVQPYLLVIGQLTPPAMDEDFRIAFSGDAPLPGLTAPLEAWRLYPDGTTEPVRGLEFVGVDRRALRDIVLTGRRNPPIGVMDAPPGPQRSSIGPIGGLPSSWAVPDVLISELELHGGGGREPRILPPPP